MLARFGVNGADQLKLAVGKHLVAHIEALDAFAGFVQDERGVRLGAHS